MVIISVKIKEHVFLVHNLHDRHETKRKTICNRNHQEKPVKLEIKEQPSDVSNTIIGSSNHEPSVMLTHQPYSPFPFNF